MKIKFIKEFKCCSLERLYPDVYLRGQEVETKEELGLFDPKLHISGKMAKSAVKNGKAAYLKEGKMDNTEIKNKMMPEHENKEDVDRIAKEKRNAKDRQKRANKKNKK